MEAVPLASRSLAVKTAYWPLFILKVKEVTPEGAGWLINLAASQSRL